MKLSVLLRLRQEDGQSVVFFAMAMTGLFGVLALVVNFGNWYQSQRRAQATADAAVLSAVHDWDQRFPPTTADQLKFLATANASAAKNWPGSGSRPPVAMQPHYSEVGPSSSQIGNEITFRVGKNVPNLFGGLIRSSGVDVQAAATARVRIPNTIKWVAPLAIQCKLQPPVTSSSSCIPYDPDLSKPNPAWPWKTTFDFQFDADRYDSQLQFPADTTQGSTIAPVQLTSESFETGLACDPTTGVNPDPGSVGGRCSTTSLTASENLASGWFTWSDQTETHVMNELNAIAGQLRLVAIYDRYDSGGAKSFHVIGWAAFRIIGAAQTSMNSITVRGTFERFYVPPDGTSGGDRDFGIRSVELIQNPPGF